MEKLKKMILDDSYIKWLYKFMNKHKNIENNDEFIDLLDVTTDDKNKIKYFDLLFEELDKFSFFSNPVEHVKFKDRFLLEYNNTIYCFEYFIEGLSCVVDGFTIRKNEKIIKYEDFKKRYIEVTDLDKIINKILDKPNEFYKKVADCLTTEERLFIKNNLENRCCLNCTNASCKIPYTEKIGCDEKGNLEGYNCSGWNNDIIVGKSKVLKINDIKKLK